MDFVLPGLAIVLGLVGLILGAERFVFGASALARRMGVSPLLVGMIIIGFGTSTPEMLVSTMAAIDGSSGLALGNVVGSNITNLGLVAGLAAVIRPIELQREVVWRETPVLILVTGIVIGLLFDLELDRIDGAILAGLFGLFLLVTVRNARAADDEDNEKHLSTVGYGRSILWLSLGLVLLMACSRAVVWGASTIAVALGVSDLIIGLTIVAIGTSLPELASSVAAALKGEHAMAIGNVIGSNMFNLLAVLAIPALIAPGPVDRMLLVRDCSVMAGFTILLFLFAAAFDRGHGRVNRVEGSLLLVGFAAYLGVLVADATGVWT